MNTSSLLLGILPLLVFVIVDSFTGLKYALVSAVVMALLEAALSLYFFGEIDIVTGFSFLLVLIMAATSYKTKSSLFIKFQPVILSAVIGLALLISYWMGKPLLVLMMTKYQNQMPEATREMLANPLTQEIFSLSSHYLGYAF